MKRKHINPLKEKGKKEALSEESLQNIAGGADLVGKGAAASRIDMVRARKAVALPPSAAAAAPTADIKAMAPSKADIRVKETMVDFGTAKKTR